MAKPKAKKDEPTFKNISYSVTYEENAKREKVKQYFESVEKKQITSKEFEMYIIDLVHDDIFKSEKPKP